MSRQFCRDIRRYNCALCLVSLQANEVTFPSGPSAFRTHGEAYRVMGRCVRQTDSSLFIAAMQVDIASQRLGTVHGDLMK